MQLLLLCWWWSSVVVLVVVLGIKLRDLYMVGKCSITVLYAQFHFANLVWWFEEVWPPWTHVFEGLAHKGWHY